VLEVLGAEVCERAEFELATVEGKRGFEVHAAIYGVVMRG
jgi:hypothetical protein